MSHLDDAASPRSTSQSLSKTDKPNSDDTDSPNILDHFMFFWRKQGNVVLPVFGLVMGSMLGFLGRVIHPSQKLISIIAFPGSLFTSFIQLLSLPIMCTTAIAGLARPKWRSSKTIAVTGLYIFLSSLTAIGVGFALVFALQPGASSNLKIRSRVTEQQVSNFALDVSLDILRNLFPNHFLRAFFQTKRTTLIVKATPKAGAGVTSTPTTRISPLNYTSSLATPNSSTGSSEPNYLFSTQQSSSSPAEATNFTTDHLQTYDDFPNTLGILCLACLMGLFLNQLKDEAVYIIDIFTVLNQVMMTILVDALWFAPFAVTSYTAAHIMAVKDMANSFADLGVFIATCLIGLLIQAFVLLPLLYMLVTRLNPLRVYKASFRAILMALSTTSSWVTLPVTLLCVEENLGIDKVLTRLVLPITTQANMNGSAIFLVISAKFLANFYGVHVSAPSAMAMIPVVMAAAFSTMGTPGSATAVLTTITSLLALPPETVIILTAVDWFVDRLRTVTNVLGDIFGVCILNSILMGKACNKADAIGETTAELESHENDHLQRTLVVDRVLSGQKPFTGSQTKTTGDEPTETTSD